MRNPTSDCLLTFIFILLVTASHHLPATLSGDIENIYLDENPRVISTKQTSVLILHGLNTTTSPSKLATVELRRKYPDRLVGFFSPETASQTLWLDYSNVTLTRDITVTNKMVSGSVISTQSVTIHFQTRTGRSYELNIVGEPTAFPKLMITDQLKPASIARRDTTRLPLRKMLDTELPETASFRTPAPTSKPTPTEPPGDGSYVPLAVIGGIVALAFSEGLWIVSAMNYSAKQPIRGKADFAIIYRILSWLIFFPILIQEVLAQLIYYCMNHSFGGLELIHYYEREDIPLLE